MQKIKITLNPDIMKKHKLYHWDITDILNGYQE